MARKLCPACNKLNAGSATSCACGHAFATESIVPACRTTKECPACRTEQPKLLARCGCGHEFTDIVELREEQVSRVHLGWIYIGLGTVLLAACIGITIVTSGTWVVFSFGGLLLAFRGLMIRTDARATVRAIDGATGELPSAKVQR